MEKLVLDLKKKLENYEHNFEGTGIEELFSDNINTFTYGEEIEEAEEYVFEEEEIPKLKNKKQEFTPNKELYSSFGKDLSQFKTPEKNPTMLPDTTIPKSNNSINFDFFNSFN